LIRELAMFNNYTLATSDEQLTPLDDDALAAVIGGDGPWGKILGELVKLLWDCVKTGLDDVISAADEGYADAQAS
jgi:hypothetical protein